MYTAQQAFWNIFANPLKITIKELDILINFVKANFFRSTVQGL